MTPYTDVHVTIQLENRDLTTASDIHVTVKQEDLCIDTTNVTVTSDGENGCYLAVKFSQIQTGLMKDDVDAWIQPNWLNAQGEREAVEQPSKVEVGTQLLRRFIYGS